MPEVCGVQFHILWVVALKCEYKRIGTLLSNILWYAVQVDDRGITYPKMFPWQPKVVRPQLSKEEKKRL